MLSYRNHWGGKAQQIRICVVFREERLQLVAAGAVEADAWVGNTGGHVSVLDPGKEGSFFGLSGKRWEGMPESRLCMDPRPQALRPGGSWWQSRVGSGGHGQERPSWPPPQRWDSQTGKWDPRLSLTLTSCLTQSRNGSKFILFKKSWTLSRAVK